MKLEINKKYLDTKNNIYRVNFFGKSSIHCTDIESGEEWNLTISYAEENWSEYVEPKKLYAYRENSWIKFNNVSLDTFDRLPEFDIEFPLESE